MLGTRVEELKDLWGPSAINGGYAKDKESIWYCRTPNGHYGNLGAHEVKENPDGTISVTPSILVSDNTGELYHGYLKNGIWTE